MAADQAPEPWTVGECGRVDEQPQAAAIEAESEPASEDDAAWLPVVTADDRLLVRQYMLAYTYPNGAIETLDEWPVTEVRHLVTNARVWKAAEAQRAADKAESERRVKESNECCAKNREVLEQIWRDQARAIVARDRDQCLIVLTAREARRSAAGNHTQGNPGLELERHLRQAADERRFATGPPHWDGASRRLFIDLYHREAERWWDCGEARGLVRVWLKGTVLESKRSYRQLYPFQRAAITAAYLNRPRDTDSPASDQAELSASISMLPPPPSAYAEPLQRGGASGTRLRVATVPPDKETPPLAEPVSPAPASAQRPPPDQAVGAPTLPAPPGSAATATQVAPTADKSPSIPNARKGYKLTLWVSATGDQGTADVHGLVQLDGADPIPFCHLRGVQNPLAGALQEAYLAVERVRAKPPRMAGPAAAPTAKPTRPSHQSTSAAGRAAQPHATSGPARSRHPATGSMTNRDPATAPAATAGKRGVAQPALF